jgi:uncharacterized OB-fold protein
VTRFVENTITFPYQRSLGPVVGAFMTALTERRILGIRNGDAVLVPPMEWDPATGAELALDLVEVGPAGTVETWTWVPEPSEQHLLDRPFAFAFVRLDGATTPLLHAVDAGSADRMSEGMRVAPRWKGTRVGRIDDLACFVPGETPETEPFARVFVLLDDTDVVITYSPTVDLAAGDVRVGLRVRAVWAEAGTGEDATGGGMTGSWGDFLGWTTTGEPDVDDPDLVNRIF